MALKAGYIGIKKSWLGLLNSLNGAKVIKTIGDGLSLTNKGKLSVTAATASKLGGVKIGSGINVAPDGTINAEGVGDWQLVGSGAVTGINPVTIPEDAKELLIVGTYNNGTYTVGASMVINAASLGETVIYFDCGGGSSDALFLRYGITDEQTLINTAKSNNQNVAASLETTAYYR